MNSSPSKDTCPICHAPLPGGALAGVCEVCSWNACLEADPEIDAAGREAEHDAAGAASRRLFTIPGHDVLEEIARGGGGIVYRARQLQPNREVAVKILPPHQLASPEMRARFRAEAETIANLDHPAILPVHVVGETDGLPFFTMKLARGGTLQARRNQFRGQWREIATLLATLADAVHYAHMRGVIHRDIKPGNVLFDEEGHAFVSDFGLAKFVDDGGDLTRSHNVIGTPAFIAPELLTHGAAQATSASDIYGLGAILYELVTGRPPFVAATVTALLREVAENTPARPRTLDRAIPRELELICLRCLAKDPAHRFFSAADLADELRCWLTGKPIRSRPANPALRTWLWMKRKPVLAGLSFALAVASVAVLVGAVVAWRQARIAQAEKQRAEDVKNFLTSIFEDANPYNAEGKTPSATELLTNARAMVNADPRMRPELRVEIMNLIGTSLIALQDIPTAEDVIEQSLREARATLTPDDPLLLRTRVLTLKVHRFRGRRDEMRTELATLLPELRANRRAEPMDLGNALLQQAQLALADADHELAEHAAREALDLATTTLGERNAHTIGISMVLALSHLHRGQIEPARAAADRAYPLALEVLGPRHPVTIEAHGLQASVLAAAGQLREAVKELTAVLHDAAAVFGADSMFIGYTSQRLAGHQLELGELEAARATIDRAIRIHAAHAEPGSFIVASATARRGEVHLAARRVAAATQDLATAVAALETLHGAEDERTQRARVSHALALALGGHFADAEPVLRHTRERAATPVVKREATYALGVTRRLAGDLAEARQLQKEALQQCADERDRPPVLTELGIVYVEQEEPERALAMLREALALYDALQTGRTPQRVDAMVALGRALMDTKQLGDAQTVLEDADAFWRGYAIDNRWAGEAAYWLGRCLEQLDQIDQSRALLGRATVILSKSPFAADAELARLAREN